MKPRVITQNSWVTISEVADLVRDSEDNIQSFIRDDRIPYLVASDGVLIWWGGFQTCMYDLYDLAADLQRLNEAIGRDTEED